MCIKNVSGELNASKKTENENASSPSIEDAGLVVEDVDIEKKVEDDCLDRLEDDDDMGQNVPSQFEHLQNRLLGSLNRDRIDQIAVDFAWINSKGARKRLIRLFLQYSKSRAELIPYFSRLIACLNPYVPEIGEIVIKSVSHNSNITFISWKIPYILIS